MNKKEAKYFSEVLKAYSEGKEIEVKSGNDWIAICKEPWFTGNPMSYRVKPEPKYRPYKNAEEFLNAQKEHGPHLHNSYGYIIPIAVYDDKVVCPDRNGHEVSFAVLKDGYTWQDGTQTGVLGE